MLLNLTYQWELFKNNLTEDWIRHAYSYVAQLDMKGWQRIEHTSIFVYAMGDFVQIIDCGKYPPVETGDVFKPKIWDYRFTMGQGKDGSVFVQEWQDVPREVILEYGSKHETHWHEVFRTGKRCQSVRFVYYLSLIYGGPNV